MEFDTGHYTLPLPFLDEDVMMLVLPHHGVYHSNKPGKNLGSFFIVALASCKLH